MRRKDREITDKSIMEDIIANADICHLAMVDDDKPYLVPVNFGYENDILYIHGAVEGKKIDVLKKNNNVCFEIMDRNYQIKLSDPSHNSTTFYRSVIGNGKAHFIDDKDEKIHGLDVLLKQYGHGLDANKTPDAMLKQTAVIKIVIEKITGKAHQSGKHPDHN